MKGSRRRVAFFCQIVLATILSRGLITEVLHFFYHHARPFEALHLAPLISEADWSFPSGHAAFYFALAASIYFFDRNIGLWYFLLAALNGVARIFVGVHWPLDVLGGAVIGFVCAALVYNVLKKYIQNGGEGPLSAPTSGGTAKE